MNLVNSYGELNNRALELIDKISVINENYLKNNIEYPYEEVNKLVLEYDLIFKKRLKKKNSFLNKILSKISSKKRKMLEGLKAYDKYDVLNLSSEKVTPQILEVFDNNRLDEEHRDLIKDKLFPVVNNLNLRSLVDLYKKCKKNERILHNGNALAYLQEMFVEYIISNILHDHKRKGIKSGVVWTYNEICKNILDESVLKIRRINKD